MLELLEQALEILNGIGCKRVLWCGDFNVTFSALDFSRKERNSDNNRNIFEYWLDLTQYADVFCLFHPFDRKYSFIRSDSAARLDYFFSSVDLLNQVIDVRFDYAFASDHAPLYMYLSTGRNTPGRNYWKFPSFLLCCNEYKDLLRNEIPIIINRYKYDSNPGVLWDMVKSEIARITIRYVQNKNKRKKIQIEECEARVAQLYQSLFKFKGEEYNRIKNEIESSINSLNALFKADWKEYFIGRWAHCNEKSSKMFFRRIQNTPGGINMLYNSKDEEVHDDKGILGICSTFYSSLYTDSEVQDIDDAATSIFEDSLKDISFSDSISTVGFSEEEERNLNIQGDCPYAFIPDVSSDVLSKESKKLLNEPLTLEEIRQAVLSMKKNKAPGLDGLPPEFYQEFFDVVGEVMYYSLVHAFNSGELSISQKRGIIKLIPKVIKTQTM